MWADDVVTLSLQYSTQWDSLAHVGAEFDADGDGIEEAVYYNGYRAGVDLVGPKPDAAGDGGNHRCFAHHLGLEHMAYKGVQGRGVLVDLAHHLGHDWRGVDRKTLEEIMAADNVVVEPGDMLLLHTGFATEVLEMEPRTGSREDPHDVHVPRRARPVLLEWIAESQISALVADNYAVEGLVGRDRDESRHSLLPIHHLCLFRLGVPLGEMWYLHELATWLREHNRSRFLLTAPPLRLPGRRRLATHPGRNRLTCRGSTPSVSAIAELPDASAVGQPAPTTSELHGLRTACCPSLDVRPIVSVVQRVADNANRSRSGAVHRDRPLRGRRCTRRIDDVVQRTARSALGGAATAVLDLCRDVFDDFELSCADSPIRHEWGSTPAVSLWIDCDDSNELQRLLRSAQRRATRCSCLSTTYGFSIPFRLGW